jgi:hypothetical protein
VRLSLRWEKNLSFSSDAARAQRTAATACFIRAMTAA